MASTRGTQGAREVVASSSSPGSSSSLPEPPFRLLTTCVEHGCQDGGEPGSLAVAGLELMLQVSEEDADAHGEAQGEALCHHSGQQDHPGPAAICTLHGLGHRRLGTLLPRPQASPPLLPLSGLRGEGTEWHCQPPTGSPASLPGRLKLSLPLAPAPGMGGAPPPGRWPEAHMLAMASPFTHFSEPAR